MAGVDAELLDEDGGPHHLLLHLREPNAELVHVLHHADALAAAPLRRLPAAGSNK